MVQQVAVQAPVTFRRGCRRKQAEKYKDLPDREGNYGKHTGGDPPVNLSLIGTFVDADSERRGMEGRSVVKVLSETTAAQTHTSTHTHTLNTCPLQRVPKLPLQAGGNLEGTKVAPV